MHSLSLSKFSLDIQIHFSATTYLLPKNSNYQMIPFKTLKCLERTDRIHLPNARHNFRQYSTDLFPLQEDFQEFNLNSTTCAVITIVLNGEF